MHTLYTLWSLLSSALRAMGRTSDRHDQAEAELYLANSQSIAELEYRERDWLHTH